MVCEHCGAAFPPKHPRARFCRSVCRLKAWHHSRHTKLAEVERLLHRALDEILTLRQPADK